MKIEVMGHLKDTEATRKIGAKFQTNVAGASVWFDVPVENNKGVKEHRCYVKIYGAWHGVYKLTEDDLEKYPR